MCVCVSFNTSMLSGHFTWKLVLKFASFDVTSIQQNLVPVFTNTSTEVTATFKLLTAITAPFIMVSTGSLKISFISFIFVEKVNAAITLNVYLLFGFVTNNFRNYFLA